MAETIKTDTRKIYTLYNMRILYLIYRTTLEDRCFYTHFTDGEMRTENLRKFILLAIDHTAIRRQNKTSIQI